MKSIFYLLKDTLKIFIVFTCCTLLFYFGLRAIHTEYEDYRRYDPPKSNAVKVFNPNSQDLVDRLSLFFRLGE
ncbi:YqzK family protein [Aquibacillus salsiterrae]|uniref:YqzK family protein n=1 Tax=Aquibacillus salsiterrae TaxID=2950439 RepID=A0A9X3WAU4_9BACI|nr:YqzK family protein [Aquibacillus salsiterrae]MDC3415437.1 YqzK family protein [Aquibacillus salsiterrae]